MLIMIQSFLDNETKEFELVAKKSMKTLVYKLKIYNSFDNRVLPTLLVPIKNYYIDKTLILMKIIIYILMI